MEIACDPYVSCDARAAQAILHFGDTKAIQTKKIKGGISE